MLGSMSCRQFMRVGVAMFLIAGSGMGAATAFISEGIEPGSKSLPADLVAAIRNGNAQVIENLLDKGADINGRDSEGNTPLILASFYASPGCVEILIERGADVNSANKVGVTPLIRAATNFEKSRLLLAAGAKVQVRTTNLANTPLLLAARRPGNSRTVQLLLEHGADAREANNAGVSPVLTGAAGGDLQTVRLLLEAGGKADYFPKASSPADVAGAGFRTPLMWAAYRNDVPMVRLLLVRGANPNQSTYFGNPLSHACWNDSQEAAEMLIFRGAKVNARDALANFTPLHWAAGTEKSSPQMVKLLLAKGANPNAAGGEPVGAFGLVPQTPRLIAEKRGHTAIVDALIAAGAKETPGTEKRSTQLRALPDELDHSLLIAATEKAIATLQSTAAQSRQAFVKHASKQDCVSCHQQYLPMAAVGSARNRSVRFDHEAAKEQIDSVAKLTNPFFDREYITQTLFHPEPAHTLGYHLFGFVAEGVPPCAATDGIIHHLVTIQTPDGRWLNQTPRPPMTASDVSATALAIQAIQHYGWPGRNPEFADSIERARGWLWKVQAETNEEAVFQLLGLHWAGEPAAKLAGLARSLQNRQREDGGWAQLPKLESDAYATGEALYTLVQTGTIQVTDPSWQRALRFLLERQESDGSWHVIRRTFPFQPTMESGFAHHRDAWISAAGTSWAVLAITQALPIGTAPHKALSSQQPTSEQRINKEQPVEFVRQIKPLLERSCVACHSGEKPRGFFRIDGRDALLRGGASGTAAIVLGHSEKSHLLDCVSDRIPDSEMPPKAMRVKYPALTTDEVALLRAWIDQGAEWPTGVILSSPAREKQR